MFSSPPPRSPTTRTRKSVAISPEKAEAMKYARSIGVFVGPQDAVLLKKYLEDGKAIFDAELMEKTGQVHVNINISSTEIIMEEVPKTTTTTKKKKKKKKNSTQKIIKQISLKNITNIQESMAPSAFTIYTSTGQALYMTCNKRGLFLGCIKGFQGSDKKSVF